MKGILEAEMNHLNKIFSTAQRLQASRSFLRDLRGLDKTTEGVEFAKAIGEAAAMGATPEDVVEQVVKAMAGNEGMALEILGAVQEIAKAHVEQHTRTLANGKTVNVKAYENARTQAMKQTTMAHGATFHAMRTKTPEAHENAAAAHTAAAEQHGAAHEIHPMDVPEVGREHANLKAQHQMSADYHRQEAATLRHGHGYAVQADKASTASQGTKAAITTHQSQMAHQKAAEEHKKAHEFNPNEGHGTTAEMHTSMAQAANAVNQAANSPHQGSDVKQAANASLNAFRASDKAHQSNSAATHTAAAKAHEEAINQHMGIHGAKESDEDGHHGQIAKTHMAIHAYHSAKAKGEEVAKAHVEGHTRTVGGKVVQVQSYDTHHAAAMAASGTAHTATGKAQTPEQHSQAAALHMKASEAHKTAAAHAPEEWMKKGHEDNAKLSEHYAQAHHAKAKAADQRADTGVDTPQHTVQDIKEMENHPDYAGHGYLGHLKRSEESDKHLAEAANKAGISHHELAAHVLSSSGRHMVDDHTNLGEKAGASERVAHMHRWITDPKNVKHYGIKEYAKDLEERAPKKATPAASAKPMAKVDPERVKDYAADVRTRIKEGMNRDEAISTVLDTATNPKDWRPHVEAALGADEPVTVRATTPSKGYAIPKPPEKK